MFFAAVSRGDTNIVDASTLNGKFLLGYQGWHACAGDGSQLNSYIHWNHSAGKPTPTDAVDDIWPDLSEFPADELFTTDLTLGNGQPAKVYSAYKTNTVLRHCQWMRDYGIDGVFVQRFIKDVYLSSAWAELRNKNLQNVKLGAETYGRVFCVEYDMSNDDPALVASHLQNDWAYLTGTLGITNSSRYIRHKGKPVVAVWGLGFSGVNVPTNTALTIINNFKAAGCTVMGGTPYNWRFLNSDSQTDPNWAAVYKSFDIINPWAVGRYSTTNQMDSFKSSVVAGDLSYCQANGIDYMPVIFPGYSAANLNGGGKNGIPRIGGRFYWRQAFDTVSTGCNMLFGAMFDEIDEGTATYKLAPTMSTTPTNAPVGNNFFALDVDGESLPSDWYLRVAGEITKALRKDVPLNEALPISPTNGVVLTSPIGGETWTAGVSTPVTWNATGVVSGVNIDLSTDGGFSWSRLAYNVANSGSKSVNVPFISSTNCRIRVSEIDGTPADFSKADFTIRTNSINVAAHLNPLWKIAPGERSYINTTGGASAPFQRSIAYNSLSNQVYIVSRTGATTGQTVKVLDASTGADLYQLNVSGISGGNIVLLSVAVADDGAIYAGNMSSGAAVYRIYRWANSSSTTVPVRIFSGEPAGRSDAVRWGDTLAVKGSGTNTEIIIDAQNTNLCAVFTPTDSTMANWISRATTQEYFGKIGRSLQFGETNSFWQKIKGNRLQQSTYILSNSPSSLTVTAQTNLYFLPDAVGPVAIDFQRKLLAALNFSGTTNSPDTVDLYDIADWSHPALLSKYSFPTNQQGNANFIGQIVFSGDKLFAIDGNNGVLGFSIIDRIDPPLIFLHPQSTTNTAGSVANFSVSVNGTPPFDFQWRKNGTAISGATTSAFAITNVQAADGASYSVAVTNLAGSVTSSNALLTVVGPPVVTTQPQGQTVAAGTNVSFTASVSGTAPFIFRWKKNGTNLADGGNVSGATNATLNLSNVQSTDNGSYSLSVSNSVGSDTSTAASLMVVNPPAITSQPASKTTDYGTTATFSVAATGENLSYQWRKDVTNYLADGDNVSGANSATLTLSSATRNDAANYFVTVSNLAGVVTSSTAGLVVNYPFPYYEPFDYPVSANLGGQTAPNGLIWSDVGTSTTGPFITVDAGNLSISGLYSSTGNRIKFGGLGKSARFSFAPGNPATSGTLYYSFALKVTDTNGISTSGGFIAGFNNSTGTQTGQPTVVGTRVYLRGTNGGFNIGMSKNSSTTTDWTWDPRVFTTNDTIFLVGSYQFNNTSSTDDISQLWINPNTSNFGAGTAPPASLTNSTGNDMTANQIASFVFFQRSSTAEPAAMIADELRLGTAWAQVTPSFSAAPVLTTQPRDQVVNPGTSAMFSVVASGSALAYQWRFNGTNILNATNSSFTRSNAQNIDVGNYSVMVSNAFGSVISSNATLTVAPSSVVTINSDKVLVINGRKVFPITLSPGPPNYGKTPTGKDGLQELREAGALFVRIAQSTDWNNQLILDQQTLLNWAYQNGMFCLLNLRELSSFSATNTTTEPALRSLMSQFKNHPALGMWKNQDEAWWGGFSEPDLQRGYEVIKNEDPFHPVEQTHAPRGTVADLQPYNAAADLLAVDIYPVVASGSASNPPITNTAVSQVGDWTRQLSQVVNNQKSFWMIEQIVFSGTTPPAHTLVYPTFHQSRFMAYQAIINGSRGLMFFGGNVAAALNAQDAPLGWNWTFWNDVLKPVVQELGDHSLLADALVAPVSTLPITMSGTVDPDLEFCVREVPPNIYIFASKREGSTVNVTFRGLPTSARIGDVLYETGRTVTAQNGQFTDSFAPLDVHVYRFAATNQAPTIISPPQSQSVVAGSDVLFSASANGTEPFNFQWRFNGNSIPTATNSTFIFSNAQPANAGSYSVVVSNFVGAITSDTATLNIIVPPTILVPPQNQSVVAGTNVSFSVSASGTSPLQFQWLFNAMPIPGATNSDFIFSKVSMTNAGTYAVIVSNAAGIVQSSDAILTVSPLVISFPQVAGAYNGLFFESDEVRPQSSGFLTLKIQTNRSFSGKLFLEGDNFPISGKFGADGQTNRIISRTNLSRPNLLLNLEIVPGTDELHGAVQGENWTALLRADREIFSKTNATTNFSGKYTMLLPREPGSISTPPDFGYGLITVKTNGRISLNGLLADNERLSQSVAVGRQGQWPFYVSLYRGISSVTDPDTSEVIMRGNYKGAVLGWLVFTNSPGRQLTGEANWIKTPWTNGNYADGFTNQVAVLGSLYVPPAKGARALNLANATLIFSEGNLSHSLTNRVALRTNNAFTVTASNTTFKISLSANRGSLSGRFMDPSSGTNRSFKGAILQQQNLGGGFFLGTNQSGGISLKP